MILLSSPNTPQTVQNRTNPFVLPNTFWTLLAFAVRGVLRIPDTEQLWNASLKPWTRPEARRMSHTQTAACSTPQSDAN